MMQALHTQANPLYT